MSIGITVLGSSGMFATPERACSGYLVEIGGARIWMDAGAGTWRNLLDHAHYRQIDAILLTHRHPDHVTDVFQAFHARLFGAPEVLPTIPLWAPQETVDALEGFDADLGETFEIRPVQEGAAVEFAGACLSFVRMAHPPVTLGVRIEHAGKVMSYSADSGPAADFGALAQGADLFICEATLQERDKAWEGHLSAAQAAAIASEVSAKKTVLTHLPPDRDLGLSFAEARRASDGGDVQLAADGLRLEL
jgi:ribonuclease BN (tRNA processing enzyme)